MYSKIYLSMYISFRVNIVQALLSLGSDGLVCKLSQDIIFIIFLFKYMHILYVFKYSYKNNTKNNILKFKKIVCHRWWEQGPS